MNNYDNSMYLKTSDLNAIENSIEEITSEIQENVFNNQTSPLRNVQVGDDLSGKTLYLSFPKDIYEHIDDYYYPIWAGDNMIYTRVDENITNSYLIDIFYLGTSYQYMVNIYKKPISSNNVDTNMVRIKLPNDFGIVDDIDTNNAFYQYIKIYDDENIIPNYEKHTWVDNEVLTMKKIDNIENGIKNIGDYYYKPYGWLNTKEWLGTSNMNLGVIKNGVATKGISYNDLNRWVNNLSLINFDDLDTICLWNTNVSGLQWNEDTETQWEEY